MRARRTMVLGLLAQLSFIGCGGDGEATDATAIAISVRSDLGPTLRSVELMLLAPGADPEQADADRRRSVDVSEDDLPLTLVATRGERDRIQVVVRGLGVQNALLAQYRATVSFAAGETLGLPVFLASACLGRPCVGTEAQTCYSMPSDSVDMGACGELPDFESDDLEAIASAGDEHDWSEPDSNTCDPAELGDDECSVFPQCGCDAGQACRMDPAGGGFSCSEVGDLGVNETCDSDRDCGAGLACNYGLCLPYCAGNPECGAGGICLSVVDGAGQRTDTNVCFTGCDTEAEEDACAGETRCLRLLDGSFCLAPLDPCPFYNDGECDEPSGTGLCAEGTDAPDCDGGPACPSTNNGVCDEPEGTGMCPDGSDPGDCCAPPEGLEGPCDPLSQCGCGDDEMCRVMAETSADGPKGTAVCVAAGSGVAGEGCSAAGDCGPGLACIGTICKPYCLEDSDCMDADGDVGICDQVVFGDEPVPGFKSCIVQCDFDSNSGCPEGSVCADFPADECHVPLEPCPDFLIGNGTCDEDVAGGTRLCAPGTDAMDCQGACAISRPPGGVCDLVAQCGCDGGGACTITTDDLVPACRPVTGTVATNGLCASMEDCIAGHACIAGLCKSYCELDAECPGPMGGVCVGINDAQGMPVDGVSVCNVTCDPTQPTDVCPTGTLCPNDAGNRCIRPLDPCPYTNDDECDEPEGTRFCVEGTDVADCARQTNPQPEPG